MTISVYELAGSQELAGATDGQAWLAKARPLLDAMSPGICLIDFAGVRLATVSWLREAVIGLNRYVRSMRPEVWIVLCNPTSLVQEELSVALEATSQVAIAAVTAVDGSLDSPRLLGRLDPALLEAFKASENQREFDASIVCKSVPNLAASAANNRLAALESRGVLISERRGRNRVYRTVLENLHHGH